MGKDYFAKRRKRLLEKDPHCHWCGIEVEEPEKNTANLLHYPKANWATVDHLRSRMWGRRPDVGMKRRTLVLACWKCNNDRAKKEQSWVPKFYLWYKSGGWPQWFPYPILKLLKLCFPNMKLPNRNRRRWERSLERNGITARS